MIVFLLWFILKMVPELSPCSNVSIGTEECAWQHPEQDAISAKSHFLSTHSRLMKSRPAGGGIELITQSRKNEIKWQHDGSQRLYYSPHYYSPSSASLVHNQPPPPAVLPGSLALQPPPKEAGMLTNVSKIYILLFAIFNSISFCNFKNMNIWYFYYWCVVIFKYFLKCIFFFLAFMPTKVSIHTNQYMK